MFPPIWQLDESEFEERATTVYRPSFRAEVKRHDVIVRSDVVAEGFEDASRVRDQDT
jgi:hypothetical protein